MCPCDHVVIERYVCTSKMFGAKPLPDSVLTVLPFITMRLAYILNWLTVGAGSAVLHIWRIPVTWTNSDLSFICFGTVFCEILINISLFLQEHVFEYVGCKMMSDICSRRHCGNLLIKPTMREVLICHDVNNDPYYLHGLTLIPARINNYTPIKVCGDISYPFLNFSGCNVEI